MNLLGLTNARDVANPVDFPLLESSLRNVRVRQINAGKRGRIRTIRKLVQRAGHERFYTQDGTELTVQVRRVNGSMEPQDLIILRNFPGILSLHPQLPNAVPRPPGDHSHEKGQRWREDGRV